MSYRKMTFIIISILVFMNVKGIVFTIPFTFIKMSCRGNVKSRWPPHGSRLLFPAHSAFRKEYYF